METKELIKEIEIYLNINPVKDETPNKYSGADFNKLSARFKSYMSYNAGLISASCLNSTQSQDLQAINELITNCSDEALDSIMEEYGEGTQICQLIRRYRAHTYQREKINDTNTLYKGIETAITNDMRSVGNPFYESVCYYIDKKGFKSDAAFYNMIGMPRQLFAKMRNGSNNLSKKTVLWIIVGLQLDYPQANDLLRKAGYSFRGSDKRDVILCYIFRNGVYDLRTVNEVLYHFGQDVFC